MIRRTLNILLGLSASLLVSQGAFAEQDRAFGYDPYHRFGYERPRAGTTEESRNKKELYKSAVPSMPGHDVYYVYGSDAREIKNPRSAPTALQIRDALGTQAGA